MINFGGFHHVWDELAPGQVLPLPVSFGPGAHLTGVGVYGVEAVMPALNLWSARSTIAVLPARVGLPMARPQGVSRSPCP